MDEELKKLEELAKPLSEWMKKNFSPDHRIIIKNDEVLVVTGVLPGKICIERPIN